MIIFTNVFNKPRAEPDLSGICRGEKKSMKMKISGFFFDRVLIPISFFESPTFLESGICLPTNEYKK